MRAPRPSRATGNPRGRPPKLEQRKRARELEDADPTISIKALARLVGVSRERIRAWRQQGVERVW